MLSSLTEKYYRADRLPTIWCPGCSNGVVTGSIVRAIDSLGIPKDDIVIVSGIGCSSRAPSYLDFHTVHTTHGRAVAFATGIKVTRPDLQVIVITGDGDATAIGGNHLIHGARRDVDLTVVIFNNSIYGMTGGQYSPTSPAESITSTSVYGLKERPFDIMKLAKAAGATYAARSTAFHVDQLQRFIERGIQNRGFSVIEAVTTCPTYYGRRNSMMTPVDMMIHLRDAYTFKDAKGGGGTETGYGTNILGEF